MKNIQNFDFFVLENYSTPIKVAYRNPQKNSPGIPAGAFSFILTLLRKCFYESYKKRNDTIDLSLLKRIYPDTMDYLAQIYDHIDFTIGCNTTSFVEEYGHLPEAVWEKVICLSGNHFGVIDEKIESLPYPKTGIVSDLMTKLLDTQRRKEMIEIGRNLGIL
jgi:hypothetical protein